MFNRLTNFFRLNKSISIDLGTSNVLIYDKQKDKIVLNEPSVVAKDKKTNQIIAVGREAREMLGKTPDSIMAVKPLSDGVISDIDSARAMISEFIRKIYGTGIAKPQVMICVPIEVTTVEKRALFDTIINAKKVYLIEEGRAAVMGAGVDISKPEGNMVIDIGGGSTDIAILSIDEIVASKSIRVASNTFDQDIIRYVRNKFNLLIGDRTAEKIKKEISTATIEETPLTMQVKGRNLLDGIPKELTINSNEVREAIIDSINLIISAIKEVLEKCPPELAADILDNGIILTGGGSLVRNLDVLIESEMQIKVTRPENPLESVVLGAGFAFDNKKLLRTLQMREN